MNPIQGLKDTQTHGTQVAGAKRTIMDLLADPQVKAGMEAVATQYLRPEKMLRLAINAVMKTPKLADCDPKTLLGALMTAQALGLEPNTVRGEAWLIPYKKSRRRGEQWVEYYECQFQIGYLGYVALMLRCPEMLSVDAEAIRVGDKFSHMKGSRSFLEYEKALSSRGELLGAYCYTRTKDGGEQATVLPLDEIVKIRGRSETYRALLRRVDTARGEKEKTKAERKLADTPWVLWIDDMAAKSAVKKHRKRVRLAGDGLLHLASEVDDATEAGRIDLGKLADPKLMQAMVEDGLPAPEVDDDYDDDEPPPDNLTDGGRVAQSPSMMVVDREGVAHAASSLAPTPPPASPVTEWPQYIPERNEWVDSSGEVYSPERHGFSSVTGRPAVMRDGSFKARRQKGHPVDNGLVPAVPAAAPVNDGGGPTFPEVLMMMTRAETEEHIEEIQSVISSFQMGKERDLLLSAFANLKRRLKL